MAVMMAAILMAAIIVAKADIKASILYFLINSNAFPMINHKSPKRRPLIKDFLFGSVIFFYILLI